MTFVARSHLLVIAVIIFSTLFTTESGAQYPDKPLRLVAPFAAGGGSDIVARVFAQKLSERWGKQMLVDNRPGAGGIVGAQIAAKSAPDGYTLVIMSSTHTVLPSLQEKAPYDVVRDFDPVTMLVSYSFLLVANSSLPVRNVVELISLAKSRPGALTYASGGNGTASHLAAELLKSMSSTNILHVPYKGTGPALIGLISGESSIGFYSASSTNPHVKSGLLKVLASTGEKRSVAFPDLPTVSEAGLRGFQASTWAGILLPSGTPRPINERLGKDFVEVLYQPDVKEKLASLGYELVGNSSSEFASVIRNEVEKWGTLARQVGIKAE